jgi:TRAP-type mannitol/chloroaromatic compound transport system substrate-binding protein
MAILDNKFEVKGGRNMEKRIFVKGFYFLILISVIVVSLAVPAQAVEKWRYQSMFPPSLTLWRGDKYFSDLLNILAAKELEITYFPMGAIVTRSEEIFNAVARGTLNMGTEWPSYSEGRNTAFSLVTSTPCWFTPGDYMVWFWQGGGFELVQELYGKYGIVFFPHSVTGPESGQRTNKPIRKGDDYRGVKMRQCGRNQAKILKDLGGAAIFMPGGEIYLSLQRGTIDGGEYSVPEVDWSLGFQEITKYWVVPGWHQPGPVSGVMVNKKSYDKLPDRIKFMFKEAAMATMMWSWTYFEYSASEYTRKFIEKGTTITRLDDETLKKIDDIAYKYLIEDAEANPDHAKIAFSMAKYFKDFDIWRTIQRPYMYGRTPAKMDEIYSKLETIAKKHGVYDPVMKLERSVRQRMEKQEFWKLGTPYKENPLTPK